MTLLLLILQISKESSNI